MNEMTWKDACMLSDIGEAHSWHGSTKQILTMTNGSIRYQRPYASDFDIKDITASSIEEVQEFLKKSCWPELRLDSKEWVPISKADKEREQKEHEKQSRLYHGEVFPKYVKGDILDHFSTIRFGELEDNNLDAW
ncbi:MAG: hypothetical protein NVS4B11_23460 [Ktedonobacteraceae bacterium]